MSRSMSFARFTALIGIAAAGLAIASLGAPAASQAAGRALPVAKHAQLSKAKVYIIVSLTPGAPNAMQVRDPLTSDPAITVTLSPAARILRRYDGTSSFAELSVNDRVSVWPAGAAGVPASAASAALVPATRVKDFSIQVAYTQIAGRITAISGDKTQLSVQVTATKGPNRAAFTVGQNVTLDVTATTPVYFGKKSGTVSDLQVGMALRAWGLSDGATSIMSAPRAVHVIPLKAAGQTDATTTTEDGTPA